VHQIESELFKSQAHE